MFTCKFDLTILLLIGKGSFSLLVTFELNAYLTYTEYKGDVIISFRLISL